MRCLVNRPRRAAGGTLLLLGIDQILDMGRSATNVIGNSIATAVDAKWEGELGETRDEEVTAEETVPQLSPENV